FWYRIGFLHVGWFHCIYSWTQYQPVCFRRWGSVSNFCGPELFAQK
ncbi:unnamed protein product, partial [Callosobruchus maculatus]